MKKTKLFGFAAIVLLLASMIMFNACPDPEPAQDPEYTITVTTPTNGTLTADKTKAKADATITIVAKGNTGYELKNGASDITVKPATGSNVAATGTGDNYTFKMPKANVTISATFTAVAATTYTITKATVTNGSFTTTVGGTEVTSALAGATVTITATPATGYEVDAISVAPTQTLTGTGNTRTFTMPAANVTVTVTFKVTGTTTYAITKTAPINGDFTIQVGGGAVTTAAAGATVTLTATPASGYTWTSFTVMQGTTAVTLSGTTANIRTFTMPAGAVTVSAVFTAVGATTYTVTVTQPASGGTISASPTTNVAANTTVTLTATPASGKKLSAFSFTSGGSGVVLTKVSDTVYTFPMPAGNVTVTATFEDVAADSKLYALGPFTYENNATTQKGWGFNNSYGDLDFTKVVSAKYLIIKTAAAAATSFGGIQVVFQCPPAYAWNQTDAFGNTTIDRSTGPVYLVVKLDTLKGWDDVLLADETRVLLAYYTGGGLDALGIEESYLYSGDITKPTGGLAESNYGFITKYLNIAANGDITTVNPIVVSFNTDGGTPANIASVDFPPPSGTLGTKFPTAPTKPGYDFVGWYVGDSTVKYESTTTISTSITLTARWEENPVAMAAVAVAALTNTSAWTAFDAANTLIKAIPAADDATTVIAAFKTKIDAKILAEGIAEWATAAELGSYKQDIDPNTGAADGNLYIWLHYINSKVTGGALTITVPAGWALTSKAVGGTTTQITDLKYAIGNAGADQTVVTVKVNYVPNAQYTVNFEAGAIGTITINDGTPYEAEIVNTGTAAFEKKAIGAIGLTTITSHGDISFVVEKGDATIGHSFTATSDEYIITVSYKAPSDDLATIKIAFDPKWTGFPTADFVISRSSTGNPNYKTITVTGLDLGTGDTITWEMDGEPLPENLGGLTNTYYSGTICYLVAQSIPRGVHSLTVVVKKDGVVYTSPEIKFTVDR